MKTLTCDGCKKEITPNLSINKPIYSILKIFGSRSGNVLLGVDLCTDCSNKVITFIEELAPWQPQQPPQT